MNEADNVLLGGCIFVPQSLPLYCYTSYILIMFKNVHIHIVKFMFILTNIL